MNNSNILSRKRILVLRDSVNPELFYATLFMTVFVCLWTLGAYITSSDLQEPIIVKSITHYTVIDSNSWKIFVIPDVILLFSICCFIRFSHKEVQA